ncbi:MAG: hypothetical protein KF729_07360 [Sandaracinaceae bacterium]|nr:hypothetical protein [Sandaracinaceae bacterium]
MRSLPLCLAILCAGLLVSLAGCGGGTPVTSRAERRTLDETRALQLVEEVLIERGIPRNRAWSVPLASRRELDVDLRLAQSRFGIEWISPQDRADLGDAVPGPATGGNLRIVPGAGDQEILLLEHTTYEYVNEREHVQAGLAGARETEERLRRDVIDFLHYIDGQGGL